MSKCFAKSLKSRGIATMQCKWTQDVTTARCSVMNMDQERTVCRWGVMFDQLQSMGSIRNRWTMKTAESNGKYHSKRDTYILNLHATQLNLQQNCSRCSYRRMDADVEVVVGDEDERRRQWSSSLRCRGWRWTWPTILSNNLVPWS